MDGRKNIKRNGNNQGKTPAISYVEITTIMVFLGGKKTATTVILRKR